LAQCAYAVASATAPGVNGQIYFQGPQTGEDGPAGIYRVNPGGGEAVDLTSANGFSDERPNVSLGDQLRTDLVPGRHEDRVHAADRHRRRRTDIWVADANGANPINLTHTAGAFETAPEFSPDGTKIAYSTLEAPSAGEKGLQVMNANGSSKTPLLDGLSRSSPTSSPGLQTAPRSPTSPPAWVKNFASPHLAEMPTPSRRRRP
jgi:hypothetical protein